MRLIQLATLLSLGAGSLSILIPPTTSVDQVDGTVEIAQKIDTHGLSPEAYAITQLTQTVEIPCESCPFYSGKDSNGATYSNTPNNLVLTLSLDPYARDTISLNGVPLFPSVYTQSAVEPFQVIQKSLEGNVENKVNIGLDLFIETDEYNLSRLRLHVLSVAGFRTQADMEILEFPVFQNEGGEVFIGEVHVRPPTPAEASSVMCKDNMFCRWKAYFYDTLHKVTGTGRRKGCHGKKYNHKSQNNGHELPHNYKHHGNEGYKHKESWISNVPGLFIGCLLIGALTVSLGGILFGVFSAVIHLILAAWWFVNRKAHTVRPQPQDEEEQALMSKDQESHLEAASEYSDELPVYVENEEKQ